MAPAAFAALLNFRPNLEFITAALQVMSHTATVPFAPPAASSHGASGQKAAEKAAPTCKASRHVSSLFVVKQAADSLQVRPIHVADLEVLRSDEAWLSSGDVPQLHLHNRIGSSCIHAGQGMPTAACKRPQTNNPPCRGDSALYLLVCGASGKEARGG